jgi:hypothetical protein
MSERLEATSEASEAIDQEAPKRAWATPEVIVSKLGNTQLNIDLINSDGILGSTS